MDIPHRITDVLTKEPRTDSRAKELELLAASIPHDTPAPRNGILKGFESAVEHFVAAGELTIEEETRVGYFVQHFELTQDELDRNGAFTQLVMLCTLRDVAAGNFTDRVQIDEYDLQLREDESLLWLFPAVPYFSMQMRTSKGEARMKFIDGGPLLVTNYRLRMKGESKTVDFPIESIEGIIVQDDGIAFTRNGAGGMEYFQTGDTWFASRLIQLLIEG